ncbi:MAG: DUF4160 domain-containing protein [Phycisphaerales bacterium]
MPTILYEQGFRFAFYAADGNEPAHIHVFKDDAEAKWWLDPCREAYSRGYNAKERRRIEKIVRTYRDYLLEEWKRFFGA